jgi:Ca-activated chloride channel family protein
VFFGDPHWLYGLIAVPVLALFEWLAIRRARGALARLVGTRPDHVLLAQRRPNDRVLGALLRLGALLALLLGAARPEWGREVVRRGATGSDVVLLVDVSASMDARDVPPNRLDEARREALAVLERVGGSRIGVVAFAGDAVRLCPLTLDHAAARLVLESLSSGSISDPGTDLGRGLRMALKVLPGGRRDEQALVVWTDGEDLEAGGRAAIDEVAHAGVRVFAVGVGTPSGDVVPILDAEGRAIDVKRDARGNLVKSRLDEDLLRALAQRTRGAYFRANRPGGELPRLMSALGSVARAGRGQRLVERPVARFPLFAAVAALLLILDRLRARRRRERPVERGIVVSGRGGAAAAALLAAILLAGRAEAQSAWARGDKAFKAGRYAEAESLYAKRLKRGGPDEVRVNRATAGALSGGDADAGNELRKIAVRDTRAGHAASYNLGTLLGERHEDDVALAELRRTIERDPKDADARWSYEVIMRRREQRRPDAGQNPRQPRPNPAGGNGGGGGNTGNPAPQPGPQPGQQQSPPPSPSTQAPPTPSGGGNMSRAQADQLLNALQELARAEQQRQRKVRVAQEKKGKDW